jgi:hypothetical protein
MFNDFFLKTMSFMRYVEKYCSAEDVTDQNKLRCMHFACWVTQATNTLLDYVIIIDFPRQQRLCEGALIIRLYINCLSYSYVFSKTSYQFR